MPFRIDTSKVSPEAYRVMSQLEMFARKSVDPKIFHLMKIRASQINGCAFCIDMHTKEARATGETEQRIYLLNAWEESPFYSDRERAALEWTESVTLVSETHVPKEVFDKVRKHFSEEEIVGLTMTIVAINGWNRLAISLGADVGNYKVKAQHSAAD